jgi:hypothetical protein
MKQSTIRLILSLLGILGILGIDCFLSIGYISPTVGMVSGFILGATVYTWVKDEKR